MDYMASCCSIIISNYYSGFILFCDIYIFIERKRVISPKLPFIKMFLFVILLQSCNFYYHSTDIFKSNP